MSTVLKGALDTNNITLSALMIWEGNQSARFKLKTIHLIEFI